MRTPGLERRSVTMGSQLASRNSSCSRRKGCSHMADATIKAVVHAPGAGNGRGSRGWATEARGASRAPETRLTTTHGASEQVPRALATVQARAQNRRRSRVHGCWPCGVVIVRRPRRRPVTRGCRHARKERGNRLPYLTLVSEQTASERGTARCAQNLPGPNGFDT